MFDLQVAREAAPLRVRVEDKLRAAIDSGHFKPGQRLVERDLCALIGVGRTSVREALRQLEAEGLVTTIPYRGPMVNTIDVHGATQLYELLGVLKPFGARLFAERGSATERARLTAAMRVLKRAPAQGREAVLQAKRAFHTALTEGCGNALLKQTLGRLHAKIKLIDEPSIAPPGRIDGAVEELKLIHDAIIAGDGAAAEAACARHLEAAAVATLAFLGARADEALAASPKRR